MFNLANKQCLNSWRHPWALATTHLGVGTACMLPLWLPLPRRAPDGAREWRSVRSRPMLSRDDFFTMLPVVALLATGHVTSTLAPAFGTVAFANIIKTAEPLFTCGFSVLIGKRAFTPSVYASLLLVVCGVGLVSCREVCAAAAFAPMCAAPAGHKRLSPAQLLAPREFHPQVNFSSFSLVAGMLSNAAFALYSIGAKRLLATRDARSTYAILTALSCLTLAPVALVAEWSEFGASKLAAANLTPAYTGWRLAALLSFTGLVQYLSNEVAFCTLSMIHPITYALANTVKRSIVVIASLIFFQQSLPPAAAAGAALALLGALGYSVAIDRTRRNMDLAAARLSGIEDRGMQSIHNGAALVARIGASAAVRASR